MWVNFLNFCFLNSRAPSLPPPPRDTRLLRFFVNVQTFMLHFTMCFKVKF